MSSASNTCNPKIVMFARYPSQASLYLQNITVVCSARNIGSGTVNLISSSLVLHELKEINITYIPKPPIVSIFAPDNGSSLFGNYSINWSAYSLFPITTNLTLTNTSGYTVNITGMNESNTTYIIDTTGYNIGLWTINVSSNNAYGTGSDQISVYYTSTTTTTTTTTSSTTSTTSTTLPTCNGNLTADCTTYDLDQAGCISHYWNFINDYYPCVYNITSTLCTYNASDPCSPTTTTTTTTSTSTTTPATLPANSILWIFTVLTPILATVFTLCAFCCIGKGILPSLFASTLWYASSMWTTRIRFIDDFTVSMSEHYVDPGNWEVGTIYLAFAGIMALYTVVLVLDFIYSSSKQQNG
jgi:hypothetical protein